MSRSFWIFIAALAISACGSPIQENLAQSSSTEIVEVSPTELSEEAELSTEEAEIAAWLQAQAFELATDDPKADLSDLEPLREMVGEARIVMLGEQTHGTHEFYTMRHRLVRFLVEEMGFDALLVEVGWSESERVNAYVHGAELDGWQVVEELGYWTFATSGALSMVDWIREHNASVSEAEKISFYGMDMQNPQGAIDNVIETLETIDQEAADWAAEQYACYIDWNTFKALDAEEQENCLALALEVRNLIASNEDAYQQILAQRGFEYLLQESVVVMQGLEFVPRERSATRDKAMAQNVAWTLEQLGPEGKLVVWAHNGHIAQKQGWMGGYLDAWYGQEVYGISTALYQGSFTAIPIDDIMLPTTFEVADASKGMYEYFFNLSGYPYFLLDLSSVDVSAPGAEWLGDKGGFRFNGWFGGYPDIPNRSFTRISLREEVDAVLFIRDTTPSTPLFMIEER